MNGAIVKIMKEISFLIIGAILGTLISLGVEELFNPNAPIPGWYLIYTAIAIIIGLIIYGILRGYYSKPKMVIELLPTVGFEPSREVHELSVYNERYGGIFKSFCKRDAIDCWIEACILVEGQTATIKGGGMAFVSWGEDLPNGINFKALSKKHTKELISKVPNETGFHILRPTPDTLISAADSELRVQIKTSDNDIIAQAVWAISNKHNSLQVKRLE